MVIRAPYREFLISRNQVFTDVFIITVGEFCHKKRKLMTTQTCKNKNTIVWISFWLTALLLTFNHKSVLAQYYQGRPMLYLGVEGSVGISSFKFSSDIPELNNLTVTEEGHHAGVVFGGNGMRVKLTQGYFNHPPA